MSMTPSRRQIEAVTLASVAKDERLFVVRCSLCRLQDAYMATDLLEVYPADTPAYGMLRSCRHCGKSEWVSVDIRLPTYDDVGHLRIRRPSGVRTVQLWEDGWFG